MTVTVKVNGREIDVLDKVNDDLLCVICRQLMYDAIELECGHGLCELCAKELQERSLQSNVGACCPMCFMESDVNKMRPNRMIQRLVGSLGVKCVNASKGCAWIGELSNLKDHLQTICTNEDIQCLLNGCPKNIPRKNMEAHMKSCQFRLINCQFCMFQIMIKDKKLHEDTCDKVPVLCRSGCGISCSRNMLRNHYKTCPKHLIHCMFKGVGCKAKLKRQDMEVHMSGAVNDHMILLLEDSKEKTKSINALKKELKNATTGKK